MQFKSNCYAVLHLLFELWLFTAKTHTHAHTHTQAIWFPPHTNTPTITSKPNIMSSDFSCFKAEKHLQHIIIFLNHTQRPKWKTDSHTNTVFLHDTIGCRVAILYNAFTQWIKTWSNSNLLIHTHGAVWAVWCQYYIIHSCPFILVRVEVEPELTLMNNGC